MFSRSFTRFSLISRPVLRATAPSPRIQSLNNVVRTMSSYKDTLLQAITDDHNEIQTYYAEYTKNQGNPDAQARWANEFTWELARHSIGEELVVYPLLEKHLGAEGKKMADEDRAEHQEVKNRLYDLEKLKVGTPEHAQLLKDIMDHLKPHIEGEEHNDFPKLEKAIGVQGSKEAAASFARTKKFVPTRSHPSAPNKPPFETLAGLMAAPMDKLKDIFSKFPSDQEKDAALKN